MSSKKADKPEVPMTPEAKNMQDTAAEGKNLLNSLVTTNTQLSGVKGRPYLMLATKGKSTVYLNLSIEGHNTEVNGTKVGALCMMVRFRGKGSESPVPEREHDEDEEGSGSLLLKKYKVPVCLLPINPFMARDLILEKGTINKIHAWIEQRIKVNGWEMKLTKEGMLTQVMTEFENLPDLPAVLEFAAPTW